MNRSPDPTWPPSLSALGPSPADRPSGHNAIDSVRRQHAAVTRITLSLIDTIGTLQDDDGGNSKAQSILRKQFTDLERLLEDHRDQEETFLFLLLQTKRPNLSPEIDAFGEEHIEIFRSVRTLSGGLDEIEIHTDQRAQLIASFLPLLVGFLQRLWEHTLAEEALLRRADL